MPGKADSNRAAYAGSAPRGYKRKSVTYDEDEDEDQAYPSDNKKRKEEDDYCCEPPDIEYCPRCVCIELPDHDIQEEPPPCIPVCCRPCPYWEREIVKYNPEGKWNPKIEEKGESGHPNLKGKDNKKGGSSKNKKKQNNQKKNCKKKESFVAIGEPCNAYRCYKDNCVPKGMAYCTPKHPKRNILPPCPQKFPIKPFRFQMCSMNEEDGPCMAGCGSINGSYNQQQPACNNNEDVGQQDCNEDCIQDPCSQFYQQNLGGFNFSGRQESGFQKIPCCSTCNQPKQDDCCCCCDEENRKNKRKIPDEWLQELPVCDEKKRPNLNSRQRKRSKKTEKGGPSSNADYGEGG